MKSSLKKILVCILVVTIAAANISLLSYAGEAYTEEATSTANEEYAADIEQCEETIDTNTEWKLIKTTDISSEGDQVHYTYSYDNEGRVIYEEYGFELSDGYSFLSTNEYEYDEFGNKIYEVVSNSGSSVSLSYNRHIYNYENNYNDKGLLTSQIEKYYAEDTPDDISYIYYEYYYDDQDNLIKKTWNNTFFDNSNNWEEYTYEYDDQGNLIRYDLNSVFGNDQHWDEYYIYEYDDQGLLVKETYDGGGYQAGAFLYSQYTYTYKYNNGIITERQQEGRSDIVTSIIQPPGITYATGIYDEYGNLIHEVFNTIYENGEESSHTTDYLYSADCDEGLELFKGIWNIQTGAHSIEISDNTIQHRDMESGQLTTYEPRQIDTISHISGYDIDEYTLYIYPYSNTFYSYTLKKSDLNTLEEYASYQGQSSLESLYYRENPIRNNSDTINANEKNKIYIGNDTIELKNDLSQIIMEQDSTIYNPELAYYLMGLSSSVYDKDNIYKTLNSLGFSNIDQVHYEDGSFAAYSIADKTMEDGTKLVIIVVRGTDNGQDVLRDIDLDPYTMIIDGWHSGFKNSADDLYTELRAYMGEIIPATNTKYVVTGHSLGAAVSDIVSVYLTAEGVPQNNLYSYNFACPDVAVDNTAMWNANGELDNIFNIGNCKDPVTFVPGILGDIINVVEANTWGKYGQTRWFSTDWSQIENSDWDFSAHETTSYLDYLSRFAGFDSFVTWEELQLYNIMKPFYTEQEDQKNDILTVSIYATGNEGLALKALPDINSQRYLFIYDGTEIEIDEITDYGWGHTFYNGYEGWVYLKYTRVVNDYTSIQPSYGYITPQYYVVYNTGYEGLELRIRPDTAFSTFGPMYDGSQLLVEAIEGNWAYGSYNGHYGWAYTGYLAPTGVGYSDTSQDYSTQQADYSDILSKIQGSWVGPAAGFEIEITSTTITTRNHYMGTDPSVWDIFDEKTYSYTIKPLNSGNGYLIEGTNMQDGTGLERYYYNDEPGKLYPENPMFPYDYWSKLN